MDHATNAFDKGMRSFDKSPNARRFHELSLSATQPRAQKHEASVVIARLPLCATKCCADFPSLLALSRMVPLCNFCP